MAGLFAALAKELQEFETRIETLATELGAAQDREIALGKQIKAFETQLEAAQTRAKQIEAFETQLEAAQTRERALVADLAAFVKTLGAIRAERLALDAREAKLIEGAIQDAAPSKRRGKRGR